MSQYYSKMKNLDNYGDWLDSSKLIHATASSGRYLNIDTNVSVRSEYNKSDYDYFRNSTNIGHDYKSINDFCNEAYNRVGIIKNVIDLMGDFGCKGIRIQHKTPSTNNFLNQWFKKVLGKEVSERFLNNLYRSGNVMIKSKLAKIKNKYIDEWKKIVAQDFEDTIVNKKEIPISYHFINPSSVYVIGGESSTFFGKPQYRLRLTTGVVSQLKKYKSADYDALPDEIKNALKSNKSEIELSPENLYTYHYKKDDWQLWAYPIIYSLKDDLIALAKLRLADLSALDGAISNIRLWTLGVIDPSNPNNSIIPNKAAINKLNNILYNNVGGGTIDLVWGPDLKFQESSSQVYKFLGSEKYETTLNNIYDGMGIPSTLRSSSGSATNNGSFLAFKTLVERLQYGRDLLVRFWEEQLAIVMKAMGFSGTARIVFDKLILSDESQFYTLLKDLADRDYISSDALLEKLDMIPEFEHARTYRETKKRGKTRPNKASPFHNPMWETDMKKDLVKNGANPKDVGFDVDYKQTNLPKFKPKGVSGRPKNVTETKKRKPKPKNMIRTKSFTTMYTWANQAYNKISELVTPAVLHTFGKKNCRQLSEVESKQYEYLKFNILCGCNTGEPIDESIIQSCIDSDNVNQDTLLTFQNSYAEFMSINNREPLVEELRTMYICAYLEGVSDES